MNSFRSILLWLLLFISGVTFGQTIDSVSIKILGKWLLIKHTIPEKGNPNNKLTPNHTYTYEFYKDGTYKASRGEKGYKTYVDKGKWKVIENGGKISTYENTDVPDDPMTKIGDHDLLIIKLTKTEFVIQEYLFSEAAIGTSYYKKQ